MTWSPAKTQRLVLKHRGNREPHPPLDIFFGGDKILPLETRTLKTKCVSLGVSISKDMIFTDQRHRITTDIKAKKEWVIRFFSNITEELLKRFYWDFERLFKICDNNTRQGTFQKLALPEWDLQFSKHKLSYRAVRSFNLLPLEARQMTRGQFKNFAKAHILENMEKYRNLTLEFNVVGKIKTEADPMLIEKIKELKRISHTRVLTGWINSQNNSPVIKTGTSKFWVPTPSANKFGLRLQRGTPSKVPK